MLEGFSVKARFDNVLVTSSPTVFLDEAHVLLLVNPADMPKEPWLALSGRRWACFHTATALSGKLQ